MKSIKSIFICIALTAMLTSCGDDGNDSYQCDCVYSDGTDTYTDSNNIGEKSSFSDAESDCGDHEQELLDSGASSAECTVSLIFSAV